MNRPPASNRYAVLLLAIFSASTSAFGQSAATDPVGFVSGTVPAQSDAAATAPLTRQSVFQAGIASITGNSIAVTGSPGWQTSPKQFVRVAGTQPNSYYVQIGNGTKAGLYATITDNGASSVVVQLNPGEDLTGIATEATAGVGNGAKILIFPFWTPATLFPTNWPAGTQVLLFDDSTAGVNLAAAQILVFNGTIWLDSNNGFANASDLLIHPSDSFVVRNNSGGVITRTVMGSVPMVRHRSIISTLAANTAQDIRIAYSSPAPEVIGNSALGFSAGDQLFVFDDAQPGLNKSATQTLVFNGTRWLDSTNGFADVTTTFSLQPARGYVYRKAATPAPQDFVWQDTQTYNQ